MSYKIGSKEYHRQYYQEHKQLHPCLDCGKPVLRESIRCRSCAIKGQRSHSWKPNQHRTTDASRVLDNGYMGVLCPEHPRARKGGYVLEHILVWEEAHGKPLPKGWIIHHLNGIKSDNRPQNLVALPNKKHYLLLQAKAKRIQELEAMLNNQHQLL